MTSLIGSLLTGLRAAAPIAYVQRNGAGFGMSWRQSANRQAEMNTMGASATVFSIVNRTSTAVSKVCWHMHQKVADPNSICPDCELPGVRLVEKHPALVVLNKPNNFYTRQELFESGQQHVDLTGEAWLVLGRLGDIPSELWIARPDRMTVVTSRTDFLTGYIYTDPDGQEMPLRKEDVMQIRMPHPKDPYRGLGPVQAVLSQITGEEASAEYNLNFFRNGSQPGGVVKVRANMSDPAFDQLVERWEANHGGIANAGRTAFLEDGEYTAVKPITQADMQFVEGSNLRRDTIMLAYGASKFDLGILEDVNRASSEAAKADFADRMTVPRLDRWAGMLNNDFLPQFGESMGPANGYSLVYSNPVPADRDADRLDKTAAIDNYTKLVAQGVDPADAAEFCGLPPLRHTAPMQQGQGVAA